GYTDVDIERLHLALVYRGVGLTLDEIRGVLDSPDVDVAAVLAHQHELLLAQAAQLTDTISAVERLMDAHRKGMQLTAAEQSEIFG
ncbi:MerR family transcriptional regulator, partial [Mycobacterium sp. ITM-2017-0098]